MAEDGDPGARVPGVGATSAFSRVRWAPDDASFELDGYRFVVEDVATEADPGAFRFYKPRPMVDQYARFFEQTDLAPRSVLELGIFDGGSIAFWCALLAPQAYLAVDKDERGDSALFTTYVADRDLTGCVDTRWGVDQADHATLWSMLDGHGLDQVDLVIDDASHAYAPTMASFRGLFPRVRPGGYYIIEDWSWPFREPFRRKDHPWALRPNLLPIVDAVLGALASAGDAITQVQCFADFVAIQRGPATLPAVFDLDTVTTPPEPAWARQYVEWSKRYARKAARLVGRAPART